MSISLVVDPGKCHDAGTDRDDDPLHVPRYLNKFGTEGAFLNLLLPFWNLRFELVFLLKRSKTAILVGTHHVIQILFVVVEVHVVAPYLHKRHERD